MIVYYLNKDVSKILQETVQRKILPRKKFTRWFSRASPVLTVVMEFSILRV